jgi:hypothetical protein
VHGTLNWSDGRLAYTAAAGAPTQALAADAARPYQVVALGPPALVTVCGTDLAPSTYAVALGAEVNAYPGWVPLVTQPPLLALAPVPGGEADDGLGLLLLTPDGGELYRSANAELLYPAHTPPDYACAYVMETAGDGDAIYPLGQAAQLAAISLADGQTMWRTGLKPAAPLADVQIWAQLDAWLLLSLQYDYQSFEFLAVRRADGELGARWPLKGMPGGAVVFPGPAWEPAEPERAGASASLVVYNEDAAAWQRWSFDCAAGTLVVERCGPPETSREDNTLPVGGDGAPGPGAAPFPQRLLPAAWGAEWEIPALVDAAGRVLVIDAAGARWAAPIKRHAS